MPGHGHSSFLEWESLLWRLTASCPHIPAWGEVLVAVKAMLWSCPVQVYFPGSVMTAWQACGCRSFLGTAGYDQYWWWLANTSLSCVGPCCHHFKMAVWASAAPPSTGLVCVPSSCACLGWGAPVPSDTWPWERTARNTENPPPPQCPSLRAHPLRGLSKQLVKHHILSLLCCFLQFLTHC